MTESAVPQSPQAVTGLILDSVSRGRAEQKRIFYLSIAATGPGERRSGAVDLAAARRGKAA